MNFKYKVTLPGIKGFFRVYAVNGDNSLYSFHKQMRVDMEFPQDVPILFKGLDPMEEVVARYALVDLGCGTVDSVTIQDTMKAGVFSFVYFYDTVSRKSVNISFEGDYEGRVDTPFILEAKGPNPVDFENGYVSFEDMTKEELREADENDDDEEPDDEDEDLGEEEEGIGNDE